MLRAQLQALWLSSFGRFVWVYQHVSSRSFDCCCWRARAPTLNSACPLSEPAIREIQQPTVFLSTVLTLYIYIYIYVCIFNRLWKFVTDSFPATSNSITARCFKRISSSYATLKTPAHARRNTLFRGAAGTRETLKTDHGKNWKHFMLIVTEV